MQETPKESTNAVIRVGPAGWAYPDWRGVVYPRGMSRKTHPLTYLCQFFDVVEVDSSFYHPPAPRVPAAWVEKVVENPRFRFTAKLWRRFTHDRNAWPGALEIQAMRDALAPLREAGLLGAAVAQFPWSFARTPETRQWLARVLDAFPDWPLAVEVRHASWDRPEFYDGLRARGVAVCNIDQPLFRDSIAPAEVVTAPVAYVRLHGRNVENWFREGAGRDARYDYLYSGGELDLWINKIQGMRENAKEIFVVNNNHFAGQAVVNGFELADALKLPHAPPPASLVERYPQLQKQED